jgi:hypothetical protein
MSIAAAVRAETASGTIALLGAGKLVACGALWVVLTAAALSELFAHPIAVVPHPVRDCPLILPLPHHIAATDRPQPVAAGATAATSNL